MCRNNCVNPVCKTAMDSTMHLQGKQKRCGLASHLTGQKNNHFRLSQFSKEPDTSVNTKDISSAGAQGFVQDFDVVTNLEPQMNPEKYPFIHAAGSHLAWLHMPFEMGGQALNNFRAFTNINGQLTCLVPPAMKFVPQMCGFTGFGAADLGSMGQQYPSQGLYPNMMEWTPYYWYSTDYQQCATNLGQISANSFPKSRMNPNAKPFIPRDQSCNHDMSAGNQSSKEMPSKRENFNTPSGPFVTGKARPQVAELARKCVAVVSVLADSDLNLKDLSGSEDTSHSESFKEPSHATLAHKEDTELINNCKEDNISVIIKEEQPVHCTVSKGVVDLVSSATERNQKESVKLDPESSTQLTDASAEVNLGRNTHILSRPRLKKKTKPSVNDRKRRKKRVGSKGNNVTNSKDVLGKASQGTSFAIGSASSDDDDEDNENTIKCNSLLISPLQCSTDSDAESSEWDEVDGVDPDLFQDAVFEIPLGLGLVGCVLKISNTDSLPKRASAPHFTSNPLEHINRLWSAAYNPSTSLEKPPSSKLKKVHFAREDSVKNPLQTVHLAEEYCRKGPWEQFAADRCRFRSRVSDLQAVIDPILSPSHRRKIFDSRFTDS